MGPRIMAVIGTRPEVIKMAPLCRALRAAPEIRLSIVGTAQHRRLMDQMLAVFDLRLDHDLDLMRPGQAPGQVFEAISSALPALLSQDRPDLLLVQGDTSTALAAAMTADRHGIPVGHVEAGVRSHDPMNPFPEETNRVLIDRASSMLFAPTAANRDNLIAEGLAPSKIHVTGNTVVDAMNWILARPRKPLPPPVARFLRAGGNRPLALLTVHRRENLGAPLRRIFGAVRLLLKNHPDLRILHPVHPNPKVRRQVQGLRHARLLKCDPLDYPDLLNVLSRCRLVLSDSGGVQEEAPSLGVPVAVLRNVTDRPESLQAKRAVLAGTRTELIVAAAGRLLKHPRPARPASNPFGDGQAAPRILGHILEFLHAIDTHR